jgi:RNA polymerase sigma-70 factor (ECF subfamily)
LKQHALVEHIFRHGYGLLVASLLRRVGVHQIGAVEDSVQFAMMQALDFWCRSGIPDNPSAWLYQVAYRQLLSEFRVSKRRKDLLTEQTTSANNIFVEQSEIPLPSEMDDSMLRMIYIACNEAIPLESQLVFTLKSLCGFSIKEIALRLFITEANVYKRFSRAKQYLQKQPIELDDLTHSNMTTRLPMVHRVLYLVFTEGHLSSHTDMVIRKDLCEEAIRLMLLISQSTIGTVPETHALLALMYFHLSRMDARQDNSGALLLLEQQDRSLWNKQYIAIGMGHLEKSAYGQTLSRYHVEASIAAEHCLAPSFNQTRWGRIVASYELLERISPSTFHRLNLAISTAEWQGPNAGLAILQSMDIPIKLSKSYHLNAVLADLQYRCGETTLAQKSAEQALQKAPTDNIKNLLRNRFEKYSSSTLHNC